jgi:hypothetical protein
MNITQGTREQRLAQLKSMIAKASDKQNNYFWVDRNGEVHLDVRNSYTHPNTLFYCETFVAGNDYVGFKAARDDKYVDDQLTFLEHWWMYMQTNQLMTPEYADYLPELP